MTVNEKLTREKHKLEEDMKNQMQQIKNENATKIKSLTTEDIDKTLEEERAKLERSKHDQLQKLKESHDLQRKSARKEIKTRFTAEVSIKINVIAKILQDL